MINRFYICQVDSLTVRSLLASHATAIGWKPSALLERDAIRRPARAPWFFLDTKDKEYGFAMNGSEVVEQGAVTHLEQMFDRVTAGPPKWEPTKREVADSTTAETHESGDVVVEFNSKMNPTRGCSLLIPRLAFSRLANDHIQLTNSFIQ